VSNELIHTSAPRGLKAGAHGFTTVAMTEGLPVAWRDRLEALSGYEPLAPPHEAESPAGYSHVRVRVAGRLMSVISRVAPCGLDYSNRLNRIAHHILLDAAEQVLAGPAWLLAQQSLFRTVWSEEPKLLALGPVIPRSDTGPVPCSYWREVTGDAGWAGTLLDWLREGEGAPGHVIYKPGTDMLRLFAEAIALLPPGERWNTTFTTYLSSEFPPDVLCLWRAVVAGTENARRILRAPNLKRLDLTGALGVAGDSETARAARSGATVPSRPSVPQRSAVQARQVAQSEGPRDQVTRVSAGPYALAAQPAKVGRRSAPVALDAPTEGRRSLWPMLALSGWGVAAMLAFAVGVLVWGHRREPSPSASVTDGSEVVSEHQIAQPTTTSAVPAFSAGPALARNESKAGAVQRQLQPAVPTEAPAGGERSDHAAPEAEPRAGPGPESSPKPQDDSPDAAHAKLTQVPELERGSSPAHIEPMAEPAPSPAAPAVRWEKGADGSFQLRPFGGAFRLASQLDLSLTPEGGVIWYDIVDEPSGTFAIEASGSPSQLRICWVERSESGTLKPKNHTYVDLELVTGDSGTHLRPSGPCQHPSNLKSLVVKVRDSRGWRVIGFWDEPKNVLVELSNDPCDATLASLWPDDVSLRDSLRDEGGRKWNPGDRPTIDTPCGPLALGMVDKKLRLTFDGELGTEAIGLCNAIDRLKDCSGVQWPRRPPNNQGKNWGKTPTESTGSKAQSCIEPCQALRATLMKLVRRADTCSELKGLRDVEANLQQVKWDKPDFDDVLRNGKKAASILRNAMSVSFAGLWPLTVYDRDGKPLCVLMTATDPQKP
jgi:GTPase-associated protein 1